MAKRTREQAVREKRTLKLEKKQAAAAARRDGTDAPADVEATYGEDGNVSEEPATDAPAHDEPIAHEIADEPA